MKNAFGSFAKKESLHILRDKRTMLVVMLIPVILMVLFGFAISTEVNNINVAVVAGERTDGVRDAVERLSKNEYFTFMGYITPNNIDPWMRSGKVDAVFWTRSVTCKECNKTFVENIEGTLVTESYFSDTIAKIELKSEK